MRGSGRVPPCSARHAWAWRAKLLKQKTIDKGQISLHTTLRFGERGFWRSRAKQIFSRAISSAPNSKFLHEGHEGQVNPQQRYNRLIGF